METAVVASPETEVRAEPGKYLTFVLNEEDFGLEILKVREIICMMEITAIPEAPHYVKGVINLRGKVIPVVDLRLKFGMPEEEYNKETCTIVMNLHESLVGIIVDTVSEVLDLEGEQIEGAPDFSGGGKSESILGMAKVEDRVVILLDIDQVLDSGVLSGF